jgi:murein DD-endopeptidase MepM/ murein hydrolase activator NlpD
MTLGVLVLMGGWTITTAAYFAFRDTVLAGLIARQTQMQYRYEDRIADLRAKVDRLSSRQLLDQEQYERKLDALLRRQARLETRATALSALPDAPVAGALDVPTHDDPAPAAAAKPTPIDDGGPRPAGGDHEARLGPAAPGSKQAGGFDTTLARLQASLNRVEASQAAALNSIEASYDTKTQRMRGVLAALGMKASSLGTDNHTAGVGGPFVPIPFAAGDDAFARQVTRVALARAEVDRLGHVLANTPVRKPIMGELDLSSGFGVRVDPFGHGAAMHTGVDFRGDPGDPVRATAAGKVTNAGWSGGYGKMVEIDHGHGLVTRYGHLSVIAAHVGQSVKVGQIIGRIGSTGRSTGPHLHYETRVHGEPVDPRRFLRAGARLAADD